MKRGRKQTLSGELKFRIPSGWGNLSDLEAMIACGLLSREDIEVGCVPAYALIALSGIRVLGSTAGGYLVMDASGTRSVISSEALAMISRRMQWITEVPSNPWRPKRLAGVATIPADLSTVTLADWIAIDSAYAGASYTRRLSMLERAGSILSPGKKRDYSLAELMAVLLWISSVKDYLQYEFPDLFEAAPPADGCDTGEDLRHRLMGAINAQIRALTKGDITKEEQVLSMPLYRAFAELNAQAREYDEIKRMRKR
ncbi:MAG: hypothetical protein K2H86_09075 [Muribaculaceae bacterium]|nr:hypothetical protein [Muribaculaceae bacterium]